MKTIFMLFSLFYFCRAPPPSPTYAWDCRKVVVDGNGEKYVPEIVTKDPKYGL